MNLPHRRLAVSSGKLSIREAAKQYGLNFRTVRKTLEHAEPPGYRWKEAHKKPKLGPFIPIIHGILEADKKSHHKQWHTGRRILGFVMNMGTLVT